MNTADRRSRRGGAARAASLLLTYAALLLQAPSAYPVAAEPAAAACSCPPHACSCPMPPVAAAGDGACWVAVGCHGEGSGAATLVLTALPEHLRIGRVEASPKVSASAPVRRPDPAAHSLQLDPPDKVPR